MKTKYFLYFLLVFINLAVALSCYYYPVSRDEFFYIEKNNIPNPFMEYYDSYLHVNPRINQFFTNVISRTKWIEVIFGLLIFNGFLSALFLTIYRKLPKLSTAKELTQFLVLTAFFIFAINYFGEMFYYTPFSTNYTLSHIFYLLYIFVLTNYYLEEKSTLKNIPFVVVLIVGVYTGMSNEHVPPVLLATSFVFAVHYLIKNKKLPSFKIILFNISLFCGYLLLFFAPANKVKEATVKKSPLDISFAEYIQNVGTMLKFYFYYNLELIITFLIISGFIVFNYKRIKVAKTQAMIFVTYLGMAIFALAIVGISPLVGVRLMFFSTILIIVIIYQFLDMLLSFSVKFKQIVNPLAFGWVLLFFLCSIVITYHGNKNFTLVMKEIAEKEKISKDVILINHFDYSVPELGYFNRKILIENGSSYIDNQPLDNTSQEKNLIKLFNLKSLSHQ